MALSTPTLSANKTAVLAALFAIGTAGVIAPLASSFFLIPAAMVGIAVVALLVADPHRLWMVLALLLPFSVELSDVLGGGTNLTLPTEGLVGLVGLSILVAMLRGGTMRWTLSPLHVAAGFFLLWQWLSLVHSPLPIVSFKALIRTTSYFVCGYVFTQIAVRGPEDLRAFLKLTVALTLGLIAYGFYTQFIEGVSVYQNIAHPFFRNHCIYAAWLSFPAAFAMAALTQPVKRPGRLYLFLAIALLALLLSFVRGAWLGFFVLGGYLLYRKKDLLNIRTALVLTILVVLGVTVVTALGLGSLFEDRWTNLFDRRYVTNESRIDRWMAALRMWRSHPVAGVGIGCYPDLYPYYIYYIDSFEREIRMGAHSVYFEIMAELGTIGLAIYGALVLAFFRETRRLYALSEGRDSLRAMAAGLEGMMVVYLVHGVVNNLGPSDKIDIAFWITMGLAVSLRCSVQRERSALRKGGESGRRTFEANLAPPESPVDDSQ